MRQKILVSCIACGLLFSPLVKADETIDKLREFVSTTGFDAAYAMADQHQEQFGEPLFDLYYGIAAIETSHTSEGVLALERYRMSAPTDHQATLYLARGYLLLGEAARARAELENILGLGVLAPELTEAAKTLLDVARMQEANTMGGARAYIEAGVGSDSNVNGGIGGSVVSLPVFGQVVLPNNVTETGDLFSQFAAGAQGSRAIEPGLSVFGTVDFNTRFHTHDHIYDQSNLGGNIGLALNRAGTLWRASASYQTLWMDDGRYRSVTGLAGEWGRSLNSRDMVNAFVQYARFDYTAMGGDARDSDFYGVGIGYRKLFTGAMRPTLNVSLTWGDERNDRHRSDYSRELLGISGTFSIRVLPLLTLSATVFHQESNHDSADPLLGVTRRDRFDHLALGATYLLDRNLSLRGEVAYTDNRSNIPLYAYDRLQAALKLRYEF